MKIAMMVMLSVCLMMVVGCGGADDNLPATVPAEGVVTLDGQPVSDAAVAFISESSNYHATATTDASGRFALNAFPEKEGAVPGSYKVEVNKTLVTGGGQDAGTDGELTGLNVAYGLPQKYATVVTSGLKYTIPETGISDLKIELKSR